MEELIKRLEELKATHKSLGTTTGQMAEIVDLLIGMANEQVTQSNKIEVLEQSFDDLSDELKPEIERLDHEIAHSAPHQDEIDDLDRQMDRLSDSIDGVHDNFLETVTHEQDMGWVEDRIKRLKLMWFITTLGWIAAFLIHALGR